MDKGDKTYRFLIIIEKGDQNYGAYSPDLPGCVAVGDTLEEVEKNMQEAIRMHLQGMIEDHEPIPTPQTTARYMDIVCRLLLEKKKDFSLQLGSASSHTSIGLTAVIIQHLREDWRVHEQFSRSPCTARLNL